MPRTLLESHKHPTLPRLSLDKRADSRYWQARTFLDGKVRLKSTKTDELTTAFRLAEEWYRRELRASIAAERAHPIDKMGRTPTVGDLFQHYRNTLSKPKREQADMRWLAAGLFWRAMP